MKPDTILLFKVEDHDGRVLCKILGEAFLKKGVLWLQQDTVLTLSLHIQMDVLSPTGREYFAVIS
jgi:hypothetical protein